MTYCWLAKLGYPGYPLNNWWISQWISECLNSKSLAKFVGRRMWKDHCIGLKLWRYWTPYDQSNGSNQCFFPAQISLFDEFIVQVSTIWTVWRGFWDVNFELNLDGGSTELTEIQDSLPILLQILVDPSSWGSWRWSAEMMDTTCLGCQKRCHAVIVRCPWHLKVMTQRQWKEYNAIEL